MLPGKVTVTGLGAQDELGNWPLVPPVKQSMACAGVIRAHLVALRDVRVWGTSAGTLMLACLVVP